jgi:hypothetical protein
VNVQLTVSIPSFVTTADFYRPAELSKPVKLGLRLLVECLGALPDWAPALPFKALVINCCWGLSHADKVDPLGASDCPLSACPAA